MQHIPTRTASPDLKNFPNFLILGPQRTGTTWLFFNLHLHPEVLLHRLKETYFFNTLGKPESSHFRYPFLEDYLASFEEPWKERLKKHYICLRKSLSFYHPRIIGEATASYAVLPEEIIAEITALNPDLKGIIMLRDPLERAWSHAKKTLIRDKGRDGKVSLEDVQQYFQSSGQRQRANYPAMIQAWKAHLKPGRLYLGRYDRIATEPGKFLEDIEDFLGITKRALFFNRHLTIKLNPTPELDMPEEIKTFLQDMLAKDTAAYEEILRDVGPGRAV